MERRNADRRRKKGRGGSKGRGKRQDGSRTEIDSTASSTTPAAEPAEDGRRKRMAPAREKDPAREPEQGTVLEARYSYRLARRLGVGGFGSVFLAECLQSSPGTREPRGDLPPPHVAVKVLGRAQDRHATSSLKRELAALLSIDSPHIPKLYDWSLEGETAFSVVEYFPAGSLADAWPLVGSLDEEQTWRLITDLLAALNAAHRASILHLDVKPSNVLLDGNGGYVLTDFGVSHASRMSRGLLHQGQIAVGLGTHGYRAPEQDSRAVQAFDLRTDLWGVGATAWALYTGIDLNKRHDVLRKQEDGNIYGLQNLSDVKISCPPPLEEIVMGMLFIDPSRRAGGAGEVLAQIRAVASGFGLDAPTVAAARRESADPKEIRHVIENLVDPLWASICRAPGFERYFAKFEDGEVLSDVGETAHHTFLLLKGEISIEREGQLIDVEKREGTLVGAISTLTGAPRTVCMRARGAVWTCIFNEAELEQLVTCNSSVAVRIIRTMATRIADGPPRRLPGARA
ncbi:MAG: protein kinase [Deltaproteobacteria bacterium]|nr:protein kinase [Deltaproteobacteria bacterium]MBW2382864.1 protein kinase [Deltaproteobacteria bacterium]